MEGKRPRRDRKGIEQGRDIGKIVETTFSGATFNQPELAGYRKVQRKGDLVLLLKKRKPDPFLHRFRETRLEFGEGV